MVLALTDWHSDKLNRNYMVKETLRFCLYASSVIRSPGEGNIRLTESCRRNNTLSELCITVLRSESHNSEAWPGLKTSKMSSLCVPKLKKAQWSPVNSSWKLNASSWTGKRLGVTVRNEMYGSAGITRLLFTPYLNNLEDVFVRRYIYLNWWPWKYG